MGVFGVGRGGVGGLSEEGVGRVVGLVSEEWRVPYGPKPMAAVHPGMNLRGVCGASVADREAHGHQWYPYTYTYTALVQVYVSVYLT